MGESFPDVEVTEEDETVVCGADVGLAACVVSLKPCGDVSHGVIDHAVVDAAAGDIGSSAQAGDVVLACGEEVQPDGVHVNLGVRAPVDTAKFVVWLPLSQVISAGSGDGVL